ncbi:MAG: bifunctional UDP-N-acetylglucosamine diphosphorylase/glucosamine-1-phosphate N-acetyltransferase GlmU [Erysipelotrichaceae bacterium]|nr:bifunctional UDP-N-acetylglucosamine diphosphorylase/glucosamine-1-phosphate N-acetyltransferase GlmU [Erysipelotrichaceae bacterium]MDD3809010.1 bifunctional UDP-N-acetylglucosamine diphosphorylase/glucosamine-1-phosphate N-acetyltransferase GlmU [Erysipelotrichaceae bacterium]
MKTYAIVLAAGKGTRMKSNRPKVVHEVLYKPMIVHIVEQLKQLEIDEIFVVVGYQADQVKAVIDGVTFVYQNEQLGTGHAIMQAKELLADKEGTTLILNGDAPLIRHETLNKLRKFHNENKFKGTIMTCDCDLETRFGRIIKDGNQVTGIVEYRDATEAQRNIAEMNVGEYCFDNIELFKALEKIDSNNDQNEYYLTDVVKIMNDDQIKVGSYKIPDLMEVGGINNLYELAEATKAMQRRVNKELLLEGVQIIDPENTYISNDVSIGAHTLVEPGCIIRGKTTIGENCHIGPNCEIANTTIGDNVEIKFSVIHDSTIENNVDMGPYVRLRNNCHILEGVHMGNFVEMKNATFGAGSKAAHLSYIGDAKVGKNVNIGCGTITVNYDGKNKSVTTIEDNAFIGCNANLVAPLVIGKGAFVAAGSTVTKDVGPDDFAIARSKEVIKTGYAKTLEEKRNKK